MKIRKFTSLLALMLAGAASSMAQLSWVYNGETLADGETLTVNESADNLSAGFYISIANEGSSNVDATITKEVEESSSFMTMMCVGINCLPPETLTTPSFTVPANGTYSEFHVQAIPLSTSGTISTKFTVNSSESSKTVNIIFVLDEDDSNNGVTIGSSSGVNGIAADKKFNATLQNGTLTVTGANAGQQVRIIDLTGRVAATFTVADENAQRYDLNLGKGIYLVAIQENGRTQYAQKVISR